MTVVSSSGSSQAKLHQHRCPYASMSLSHSQVSQVSNQIARVSACIHFGERGLAAAVALLFLLVTSSLSRRESRNFIAAVLEFENVIQINAW